MSNLTQAVLARRLPHLSQHGFFDLKIWDSLMGLKGPKTRTRSTHSIVSLCIVCDNLLGEGFSWWDDCRFLAERDIIPDLSTQIEQRFRMMSDFTEQELDVFDDSIEFMNCGLLPSSEESELVLWCLCKGIVEARG